MNKIAILTDLHFGYKEGTSQSKSMYQYIKSCLNEIKNQNIDSVFILGDLFDNRESINFLTIKNTYENFIQPIIDNNLKVYIIAGNHDCYYKNTNEVYSVELLFKHIKNLHLVKNYGEEIILNNTNILLMPWINSENYETNMKIINDSNSDYLMGHFEINGFTMVRGIKCSNGISQDIFNKFKKVFSGHFHLRESKGNITYIGTPYEKDWNDHCSPKGYTILDLENGNIEFINNENNYFVTIEYNENATIDEKTLENKEIKLIINNINKQSDLDKFLNEIYKSNPSKLQIIDNTYIVVNKDNNQQNNIDYHCNDNIKLFNQYIDNLQINDQTIDKTKLNNILIEVYNESLIG